MRIGPALAPGVLAVLESATKSEQGMREERLAEVARDLAGAGSDAVPDVSAETSGATTGHLNGPEAPPYTEPYTFVDSAYPTLSSPWFDHTPQDKARIDAYWVEHRARRDKQAASLAWSEYVTAQAAAGRSRRAARPWPTGWSGP